MEGDVGEAGHDYKIFVSRDYNDLTALTLQANIV